MVTLRFSRQDYFISQCHRPDVPSRLAATEATIHADRGNEQLARDALRRGPRQALLDELLAIAADTAIPDEEVGGLIRRPRNPANNTRTAVRLEPGMTA